MKLKNMPFCLAKYVSPVPMLGVLVALTILPLTEGCKYTLIGREYAGTVDTTVTGDKCQRWADQYPHRHSTRLEDLPDETFPDAANFCRNPNNRESGPWCYTVNPLVRTYSCNVPMCECSYTERGLNYLGTLNKTQSGQFCQEWKLDLPHPHIYKQDDTFAERSIERARNYCRNPNNDIGPWCYTLYIFQRKDFCNVPRCSCSNDVLGTKYQGDISQTLSGLTCQEWSSQSPHRHFLNANTLVSNKCRNPTANVDGPWCYTLDPSVKSESCGVPSCHFTKIQTRVYAGDTTECKADMMGKDYQGNQKTTVNYHNCQRWDKQYPHSHPYTDAKDFPDDSIEEASNFCRNPDNEPTGPWCYTTDPDTERETCNVKACGCKKTRAGSEYAGKISRTRSGITCQKWTDSTPHKHNHTNAKNFPESNISEAENYCRNPDQNPTGPWCYTVEPNVRWDFCDVPICKAKIRHDEEISGAPRTEKYITKELERERITQQEQDVATRAVTTAQTSTVKETPSSTQPGMSTKMITRIATETATTASASTAVVIPTTNLKTTLHQETSSTEDMTDEATTTMRATTAIRATTLMRETTKTRLTISGKAVLRTSTPTETATTTMRATTTEKTTVTEKATTTGKATSTARSTTTIEQITTANVRETTASRKTSTANVKVTTLTAKTTTVKETNRVKYISTKKMKGTRKTIAVRRTTVNQGTTNKDGTTVYITPTLDTITNIEVVSTLETTTTEKTPQNQKTTIKIRSIAETSEDAQITTDGRSALQDPTTFPQFSKESQRTTITDTAEEVRVNEDRPTKSTHYQSTSMRDKTTHTVITSNTGKTTVEGQTTAEIETGKSDKVSPSNGLAGASFRRTSVPTTMSSQESITQATSKGSSESNEGSKQLTTAASHEISTTYSSYPAEQEPLSSTMSTIKVDTTSAKPIFTEKKSSDHTRSGKTLLKQSGTSLPASMEFQNTDHTAYNITITTVSVTDDNVTTADPIQKVHATDNKTMIEESSTTTRIIGNNQFVTSKTGEHQAGTHATPQTNEFAGASENGNTSVSLTGLTTIRKDWNTNVTTGVLKNEHDFLMDVITITSSVVLSWLAVLSLAVLMVHWNARRDRRRAERKQIRMRRRLRPLQVKEAKDTSKLDTTESQTRNTTNASEDSSQG